MDPNDIKNRASLEAWLNGRSRQDAIAIAQRTALRVAPLWSSEMDSEWARKRNLTAMPIFRQLLTLGVTRVFQTSEVLTAALSTSANVAGATSAMAVGANAAYGAAAAAAAAATTAVYQTPTADTARTATAAVDVAAAKDIWAEIRVDLLMLEQGKNPFASPLWLTASPDWFAAADAKARLIWARDDHANWSFWTRWWDGVLSGKQVNWNLQRAVALIPVAYWKKSPAHIAGLIAAVELTNIVQATPNSEDVVRGPDGLFFAVHRTTIRPDLFHDAKEKVADTIAEIRAFTTSNSVRYLESHLVRLETVLQRYPDRPQRVHDEFEQTSHAIEVMTKAEVLPSFELQDRLLRQLDEGAIDIRRSDKEVANTVKARASSRLHRMKAERKAKFDGAMHEAADESRLDLKQEILEDIAATNDPTVPEEQKDEPAYRLVSRGARMAKAAKDESVKAADDLGKIVKGAEAAGKIIEHAPGWWDIISTALFG